MRQAQSFEQWRLNNPHSETIIALAGKANIAQISRTSGMSRQGIRFIFQRFPQLGVRDTGRFYQEQVRAKQKERQTILENLATQNIEALIAQGWCPKHYAIMVNFCQSWGVSLELLFNQSVHPGGNLARGAIRQTALKES